jgi:chromosome segregation ATPase
MTRTHESLEALREAIEALDLGDVDGRLDELSEALEAARQVFTQAQAELRTTQKALEGAAAGIRAVTDVEGEIDLDALEGHLDALELVAIDLASCADTFEAAAGDINGTLGDDSEPQAAGGVL